MVTLAVACRPARVSATPVRRARTSGTRVVASASPSCAYLASSTATVSFRPRPGLSCIAVRTATRRCRRVRGDTVSPSALEASTDTAETAPAETSSLIGQVLAGVTVSLAMVPESLAFTFVAGVSPIVGLHAAALMGLSTACLGAQPGVISGAAGATAVVFAPLVKTHGAEYLFVAVFLAGAIQLACGAARLGKLIRLVPNTCMIGFVNGLAIVIGSAQMQTFKGLAGNALWMQIGLTALTVCLIKTLAHDSMSKIWPKSIPTPLAAIVAVTGLVNVVAPKFFTLAKTVGDVAPVSGALPALHLPSVPITLETLWVVLPFAASVAAVGLIETLLTQQLVDDTLVMRTSTHREVTAQGVGNVVCGLFGSMGGCAMIGQSVINVQAGGRTRVAGITCALAILAYVTFGSSIIERVPIAALTGTMLCLVIDIFDWGSFSRTAKIPKTDATVIGLVTLVTVFTNLAVAVFSGVVLSALGFAWKLAKKVDAVRVVERDPKNVSDIAIYKLNGPLFFGSVISFKDAVDNCFANESAKRIVLDFSESKLWDSSALVAVDDVAAKMKNSGIAVSLRSLSPDCVTLLKKAGDLVEVTETDPSYQVAADYDGKDLRVSSEIKKIQKTFVKSNRAPYMKSMSGTLEPWQEQALQRQTKGNGEHARCT